MSCCFPPQVRSLSTKILEINNKKRKTPTKPLQTKQITPWTFMFSNTYDKESVNLS